MNRELLVLRHAKSDWSDAVDDFQRPITDKGKRNIQRLGVWLAQQSLYPDHIVSSPATRAWVTMEKTVKAMGRGIADAVPDRRIYEAALRDLLAVLADVPPEARRVLIVGHNPGLEQLVSYLADDLSGHSRINLMATGTLCWLAMPDDWTRLPARCAQILTRIRGKELPRLFPFPDHDGDQPGRPRPSYYYTQSSVIPYRRVDGKLQILSVASSKKKHPVVPKGICTPGMTAQESAAKEALEEAGVRGEVGEQPLGQYQYTKWGATVTCTVYPMRVTEVLPESEWEESHRGREWLSPKQAAKRLKQPELGPMVKALARQLKAGD